MKIPSFLQASYQSDLALASFVSTALAKIDNHISSNRLEFFPEYTDHSIKHVELTLQTAFDLATGPARGLLTSGDAAALIVAVGLHDLGMYLTRDGFESLIARGNRWIGVPYFDQKDWSALWDDFYADATRFDDRKLRQIFGEQYRPVRPLPARNAPWDDFDNLLVGEFIRRHHPRLAHEIALYGLPGKAGTAIEICPINSEDHGFLADISGLIGRSHGIDLRICLEYLQEKYQNKINPRGIHAAFLGALLRIADYFQIQSTRAPSARTDVASFKSRLSEREWNVHQSVRDIHNTSGDPEAIIVIAEPADVQTFLRLKDWLSGLQNELDQAWAVLGEVYGLQSHNNLNLLGIKIRRVKSNIDNVPAFSKTVSYVPARVTFEAANADLLKLLIVPLYGNRPGIGLRELIQNAVDAVREFDDLASQHPELLKLTRTEQEADVSIAIICDREGEPTEIVVTDRGVGMTSEIIRDYFLKAGASFRKSSVWRKEHEDQDGRSRVLRTGRFGIGALAAYLLGDEIEVTTRHLSAELTHGIKFIARLDDEAISLNRVSCPVGTSIRVKVPVNFRDAVRQLIPNGWLKEISFHDEAGHYFLKRPSLSRHFTNRPDLPVQGWLPQPEDGVSSDWRCFSNTDFEKVFWSFRNIYPHLSCNGIVIESRVSNKALWEYLKTPKISVFDKEGRLPVNLQRTELQGALPFKEDLLRSMAEDILAHAIIDSPANCDPAWFAGQYEGFSSRGYDPYGPELARWLVAREGFLLNEPNLISSFKPKAILVAVGGQTGYQGWGDEIRRELPDNVLMGSALPHIFSDTNPRIKGLVRRIMEGWPTNPHGLKGSISNAYIPRKLIDRIKEMRPGRELQLLLKKHERSLERNGWVCTSGPGSSALDHAIFKLPSTEEDAVVFYLFDIDKITDSEESLPLMNRWMEICGTSVIPFDLQKRKALGDKAAKQISNVLEARRQRERERKSAKKQDDMEEAFE